MSISGNVVAIPKFWTGDGAIDDDEEEIGNELLEVVPRDFSELQELVVVVLEEDEDCFASSSAHSCAVSKFGSKVLFVIVVFCGDGESEDTRGDTTSEDAAS